MHCDKYILYNLYISLIFFGFSFQENKIIRIQGLPHKLSDKLARDTHVNALTGNMSVESNFYIIV